VRGIVENAMRSQERKWSCGGARLVALSRRRLAPGAAGGIGDDCPID